MFLLPLVLARLFNIAFKLLVRFNDASGCQMIIWWKHTDKKGNEWSSTCFQIYTLTFCYLSIQSLKITSNLYFFTEQMKKLQINEKLVDSKKLKNIYLSEVWGIVPKPADMSIFKTPSHCSTFITKLIWNVFMTINP